MQRLNAEGWEVHTLGRRAASSTSHHQLDLLEDDPTRVLQMVQPSHLLHLAWVTTPDTYQTSPANQRWVDVSLRLLIGFANSGGSHAVCAGTCLEYDLTHGVCTEERTPMNPAIPYAQAKHALHMEARQALEASDTSLGWARLFYLYGPGEHPQRLVAHIIHSLVQGRVAATSAGAQRRDYLYVEDAAGALVGLLGSSFNGAANVGSGSAIEVKRLAALAARATGHVELLAQGSYQSGRDEPPLIEADITRIEEITEWRPTTTIEQGLSESVQWWRDQLGVQS